jgi:hypothetical protein
MQNCQRVFYVFLLLLVGCSTRSSRTNPSPRNPVPPTNGVPPAAPVLDRSTFIDLENGWRVRVVTPLSKTGEFKIVGPTASDNHGVIHSSIQGDFAGYESAYYNVTGADRFLVRLAFDSRRVELGEGPKPSTQSLYSPLVWPKQERYVRLVFLIRVSASDHNMAILAATRRSTLDEWTLNIQKDPTACKSSRTIYCVWVPERMAVTPETPKNVNGVITWAPR